MRLYSGTSKQFIQDTIQNQIAEKLKNSFFNHFRFYPSEGELNSWNSSLRAVKDIFQSGNLYEQGIILEYQLPMTSKRLDCLICGRDQNNTDNAVIIELKQWGKCDEASGDNEVATYIGGAVREKLHPSAQVGQYKMYLEDSHTAFYEPPSPIKLNACSYLHNYHYYKNDVIFDNKFSNILKSYPLFTADDTKLFRDYLVEKLEQGYGLEVLSRIEKSRYRASKKLMEHVSEVIKGKSEYILIDSQKVVYDKVLSIAKDGFHDKQKVVLIVKGGAGTGKSVIALNLMADLLQKGYNTHYATGSKAFTNTLWDVIGKRGSAQFKYFNNYIDAKSNEIDVLICDESHRIRETSNSQFTKANKKSDIFQIEEILRSSKVIVFFIDDRQVVRPKEVGSVEYIKDFAEKYKCKTYEYELEHQFRCNGSDAFINWINNTLEMQRTANVLWDSKDEFDFKIFENVNELEKAIQQKVDNNISARMTAGFCWKWSDPTEYGELVNDVSIGLYKRPWNAKPRDQRKENKYVKLLDGIPEAPLWNINPKGVDQIGCIYTAQGFEFDYVGVIIGKDLIYNFDKQGWEGHAEESYDTIVKRSGNKFLDLVKSSYYVLLTRGMKGCYVYFQDKDTERFFKSRIEK
jgi:hypothetical protein